MDCPHRMPTEIESRALDFYNRKSSLENSISYYRNRVLCTQFPVLVHHNIMAHGHKSIRLETISTKEVDSTGLDFLLMDTTPPRVASRSQLGPFLPLTRLTHSSAQLLTLSHPLSSHPPFTLTHNFPQLSHNNLNTLSQVMFLQYWEYFLLVNIVVIC